MDELLRIGIFQTDIVWENIQANQEKIEDLLSKNGTTPDILILPEMFTTGFLSNPANLSVRKLEAHLKWQSELSVSNGISIIGSVIFPEGNYFHNRLLHTNPDGGTEFYNKRHLFQTEKQEGFFKSGISRTLFNIKGYSLMPQICYDLRFPVWSRNNLNYDILIYVANWPSARQYAWNKLLPARAIENQCYVIGVNRAGVDKNTKYKGGSSIYDATGEPVLLLGSDEEYAEAAISMKALFDYRRSFPVLNDMDEFNIDPGN